MKRQGGEHGRADPKIPGGATLLVGLRYHTPQGYQHERSAVDMTDPVCGMEVTRETAAGAWEHGGETYYFCSRSCFERFKADPDAFLTPDASRRGM